VTIPSRIGRWEIAGDGEVSLVGTHCNSCGETFFPDRRVCAACGSEDTLEVPLRGPGELFSYTVVHQAPTGFTAPLAVGYVRLPGDVLVLGPIDVERDDLVEGLPLDIHVGQTSVAEDGSPVTTYRFKRASGAPAEG
jgi:uncharacterized OB-fold protein